MSIDASPAVESSVCTLCYIHLHICFSYFLCDAYTQNATSNGPSPQAAPHSQSAVTVGDESSPPGFCTSRADSVSFRCWHSIGNLPVRFHEWDVTVSTLCAALVDCLLCWCEGALPCVKHAWLRHLNDGGSVEVVVAESSKGTGALPLLDAAAFVLRRDMGTDLVARDSSRTCVGWASCSMIARLDNQGGQTKVPFMNFQGALKLHLQSSQSFAADSTSGGALPSPDEAGGSAAAAPAPAGAFVLFDGLSECPKSFPGSMQFRTSCFSTFVSGKPPSVLRSQSKTSFTSTGECSSPSAPCCSARGL